MQQTCMIIYIQNIGAIIRLCFHMAVLCDLWYKGLDIEQIHIGLKWCISTNAWCFVHAGNIHVGLKWCVSTYSLGLVHTGQIHTGLKWYVSTYTWGLVLTFSYPTWSMQKCTMHAVTADIYNFYNVYYALNLIFGPQLPHVSSIHMKTVHTNHALWNL